jgi:hypothetical protein
MYDELTRLDHEIVLVVAEDVEHDSLQRELALCVLRPLASGYCLWRRDQKGYPLNLEFRVASLLVTRVTIHNVT